MHGLTPVALLEIKSKIVGPKQAAGKFKHDVNIKHKRYILTDGIKLKIYDISKITEEENLLYEGSDFARIIDYLLIEEKQKPERELEEEIFKIIERLFNQLNTFKNERLKIDNPITYASNYRDALSIDHTRKLISSNTKNLGSKFERIEYVLLNLIVDDPWTNNADNLLETSERDVPRLIFRYSTLEAIYSTVKYISYRLNGIQGMNDQKEGHLILDTLFEKKGDRETDERLNEIFISSCSSRRDNLTMWRLYGDNSKGAALTIEVNPKKDSPFIVKKVSYMDNHYENIVKKIKYAIAQIEELGYKLDRKIFALLPYFIKEHHYITENEIRILFDRGMFQNNDPNVKYEWGISDPYKIVRPYIDIKMLIDNNGYKIENPNLPLKIKELVLGPNCPFPDKNKFQIETMLKELGLKDVKVKKSRIDKDTYIG